METWEHALNKFLKPWKNNKNVVGALVCGSYVTGSPTKHSDIDVHITLKNGIKWRERGNKIVDGFLIEYFVNPLNQYPKYFIEDFSKKKKMTAHMLSSGRIVFDKNGDLKKVVALANKAMNKKYSKMKKITIEMSKYSLWDRMDNLEEVYDAKGDEFAFVYYFCLKSLFEEYSNFNRFDYIASHKVKRFLVNKVDKKKYRISKFPDQTFQKLFLKALTLKETVEMMKIYKKLTNHVLKEMGGLKVDGWKVRTKIK